jgi:two-component system NtrC family sensor kinase
MYDLSNMTLGDMAQASAALRRLAGDATSMEAVSQRIATLLFDELRAGEASDPACALVRVYTTVRLGALPADLRQLAAAFMAPGEATPQVRCLVLVGTAGVEPAWMSRHDSKGHRASPLPSVAALERLPMVSKLVADLGVDAGTLVTGTPSPSAEAMGRTFNVFHVAEAHGSSHIPAQDFVRDYDVRSVLGCGGLLPDGELFAVILFARVPIGRDTVDAFEPLTLAAKLALMPFAGTHVFEEASPRVVA